MSELKVTPGEWKLHISAEDLPIIEVAQYRTITVEGNSYAEAKANAHLVAASKQLYEALKRLSAGMDESKDSNPRVYADEVKQARKALAAARGEKEVEDE